MPESFHAPPSASHGRLKRALARVALIVMGVCTGTLLAEGLVRLAIDVPVTPQMFASDPVTDFRLKPNVSGRLVWPGVVTFSWTTNSRGYRATPELSVPKPPRVKRVLLLGDSFTFGQGVDDGQTLVLLIPDTADIRRLSAHAAPSSADATP